MNKINWRVRWNNPVFIVQVLGALFLPLLAYFGIEWDDLTTWGSVLHLLMGAVQNPFVLGTMVLAFWNAVNDPTTKGLFDSPQARAYVKPK